MVNDWRALWRSECRVEMPSYRILIPESVPESVHRVWQARGYLTSGQPTVFTAGMRRNFLRTKAAFLSVAGLGVTTTGIMGISAVSISLLSDSFFMTGAIFTGLVGAASAGLSGWTGWKYLRDPKRLTRKDRKAAAQARWVTPTDLGYLKGIDQLDTDEERLMHLAVVTARAIRHTRAWSHPILADHVSRVDLEYAVGNIGERLAELYHLRTEISQIREPHLKKTLHAYEQKLSQTFQSLATRVLAMHEYLEHLRALSVELIKLDHTERSHEIGERVLDVVARTCADDSADWQFRELNIEAESHSEIIRGLLGELEESVDEFEGFDDIDRKLHAAAKDAQARPAQPTVTDLELPS